MAARAGRDPSGSSDGSARCYRPTTRRWVAYGSLFAVAAGLGAVGFELRLPSWSRWGLAVLFLGLAIGALDLLRARLDVDDDAVRVRSLYGTRVYPYADIADVKVERPSLAIRLARGEWQRLPGWLGVNLAARRQIHRRIALPRAGFRELEPSSAG